MSSDPDLKALICIGVITGTHGIQGLVRIKSFTEKPEQVCAYGLVYDVTGTRCWSVEYVGQRKGSILARMQGVTDCNRAEALRGVELHVPRTRLPILTQEDEYYYADLIGLNVVLEDGSEFGQVAAVQDYGAGVILQLRRYDGTMIDIPFTRTVVLVVDLMARRLVFDPSSVL